LKLNVSGEIRSFAQEEDEATGLFDWQSQQTAKEAKMMARMFFIFGGGLEGNFIIHKNSNL
jgi:hypothetical protein